MSAFAWFTAAVAFYSFVAGLAARLLKRTKIAHAGPGEYGGDACAFPHGPCDCRLWAIWAAFWPLVVCAWAIAMFARHIVYAPIAATARLGFRVGKSIR